MNNNKKPEVYFLSSNEKIKNNFKNTTKLTKIISKDPLYIINLDFFNDDFSLSKIKDKENFELYYAVNDWVPLRFPCDNFSKNCGECELHKYYVKDGKNCFLEKNQNTAKIQELINKLVIKEKDKNKNLIILLKKHLDNIAGMYFFGEPNNAKELNNYLTQIKSHFKKIQILKFSDNINSFYKSVFNRIDYGVSIVSNDDRTIIYTNRVRRKHFGTDIIGKKCYEVFVLEKGEKPCKGCPMGEKDDEIFESGKDNTRRSEMHKLKDKHGKVYFISETASKLELLDDSILPVGINKVGINVVRDNSAKIISTEFQRIIQKLDSYHHIIKILSFALIGGEKKDLMDYYNNFINSETNINKSLTPNLFSDFANRISFTSTKDSKSKIINFGFGRMRYYRNHINIFNKDFTKIENPEMGDTLQIFASFSKTDIEDNKKIKGLYIDYKTAKSEIIKELNYNKEYEKITFEQNNKISRLSEKSELFLKQIGITNYYDEKWYDIKLEAKGTPLGYIAVDFIGRTKNDSDAIINKGDSLNSEKFRYFLQLIGFAAQAIQRAIDHKELEITKDITGIINNDYDNKNKLFHEVSKILCEKLETLKCEIFTIKSGFINRDFIYYSTFKNDDDNKKLYNRLKNDKEKPNTFNIGENMLGNVLNIIEGNLNENSKEYEKCISIPSYDIYDKYYENEQKKQVNKGNKNLEQTTVKEFINSGKTYELKNCIIAPLQYKGKVIGAIKLTNNGKTGKIFFPIHEQRILFYVAQQLATKIENLNLISREKIIDNVFNHFSELQKKAEGFKIGFSTDWRDELFQIDEEIRAKIIFNVKMKYLVNLVNADVLYYFGYDEDKKEFIKKGKRWRDTAVGLDVLKSNEKFKEGDKRIIKIIKEQKTKHGEDMILSPNNIEEFSEKIFNNNKRIIAFPIFVYNQPFSLLLLEKFHEEFKGEDKNIIETVTKQIQGVLQIAAFKRKNFEIMRNLSHQVVAPLSGLEIYTGQLLRNTLNKSEKEYYPIDNDKKRFIYRILKSQTQHVINLTKGNHYFTDIEAGKYPELDIKTFNLTTALIELASVYQPIAKSQGINSVSVLETKDYYITSDKTLLSHIGFCLIDNAIKYSDKEKDIIITILEDKANKKYIVRFIDYGLWIPKSLRETIFDRDFRSGNAKKRNPHGSGIGLYLVRNFAELLDGKCYVEKSNTRDGTIITVEIAKTLKNH